MAVLTCTSGGNYSCSGGTWGCSRAIRRLKETDAASSQSGTVVDPVNRLQVTEFEPDPGDVICVGKKEFPADKYDIVVSDLENDMVDIAVFQLDGTLAFRGNRPKKYVQYATANRMAIPVMEALAIESAIKLDVEALNAQLVS